MPKEPEPSDATIAFHIGKFLEFGFSLPEDFGSLNKLSNYFLEEKDSLANGSVKSSQREIFLGFLNIIYEFQEKYPQDNLHDILERIRDDVPFLSREDLDTPQ